MGFLVRIPHPHSGYAQNAAGQCQAGSALIARAPQAEGALDMAQGAFSCVSQPWPSLRATTLSSGSAAPSWHCSPSTAQLFLSELPLLMWQFRLQTPSAIPKALVSLPACFHLLIPKIPSQSTEGPLLEKCRRILTFSVFWYVQRPGHKEHISAMHYRDLN